MVLDYCDSILKKRFCSIPLNLVLEALEKMLFMGHGVLTKNHQVWQEPIASNGCVLIKMLLKFWGLVKPCAALQTDNTCREGKNQHVCRWSSTAVAQGRSHGDIYSKSCVPSTFELLFVSVHGIVLFIQVGHGKPRFESVTHCFGEVRHTHGPVDQRLSCAVTAITNEDVIQTPLATHWGVVASFCLPL